MGDSRTGRLTRAAAAPVVVSMLVMVVWGATPVATRVATEDLEPLVIAVLRTVLAGIVAVPLLAAMNVRPPSSGRARVLLGVSAIAGFVFFPRRLHARAGAHLGDARGRDPRRRSRCSPGSTPRASRGGCRDCGGRAGAPWRSPARRDRRSPRRGRGRRRDARSVTSSCSPRRSSSRRATSPARCSCREASRARRRRTGA